MEVKDVKDLMEIFSISNITQLHYKNGNSELLLKKETQEVELIAPVAPLPKISTNNRTPITAPLVGVFYVADSPDNPPFVEKGQSVKKGDTLCIVEAMKVLNEIKSPKDGKICNILAENGELVEFGQILMEMDDV